MELLKSNNCDLISTVIIHKNNLLSLDKFINAAIELGFPSLAFGISIPVGRVNTENELFFFTKEELKQIYYKVNQLRENYKEQINILPFNDITTFKPLVSNNFNCQAGKTSIVISEDGLVKPCNMVPGTFFNDYSIVNYISDIEKGIEKNYQQNIKEFRSYMSQCGHDLSDMYCSGFCSVP